MVPVQPLTPDRWDDFAALCAQMGANRSCWCMWWRRSGAFRGGDTARTRAKSRVEEGSRPMGLLAYADEAPVGWVAVAPREEYPRLNAGRHTAPVDARAGVWAVPCFFVLPSWRHRGVTRALLGAAVDFAAVHGASAVEGVPGDPATARRSTTASYTGTLPMFEAQGFHEVARRAPKGRVVVRREVVAGAIATPPMPQDPPGDP